jgi:uncharacterized protein
VCPNEKGGSRQDSKVNISRFKSSKLNKPGLNKPKFNKLSKRMNDRLIIMTKYPEPGKTKTRLIPALGAIGAAQVHRQLGQHTVQQVSGFNPEIHYAGGSLSLMRQWLGDFHFFLQGDGDLGDRMSQAFAQGFQSGRDRIVMIGTDCPAIEASLIQQAFTMLLQNDLVLGPARDGGYYLIGLRAYYPQLFKNILWSTETVFDHTLKIAIEHRISYDVLIPLSDIDRPEDLALLP